VAKTENQLYKPADACRMAEVAPYVLRYWETEFSALSEGKEKGSSRLYTARDVQIIARIRQLLYDEGFTVAGAKKRLEAEIQEGRFDNGDQPAPKAPTKQKLEDVEIAPSPLVKPPAPVAKPTPAPAPRTPPPPVSAAPAPAPAPPAREAISFPERKTVIRELKEIVRLLERPRKR
jgi:DNA-binding transcriptional MerR regulator